MKADEIAVKMGIDFKCSSRAAAVHRGGGTIFIF
jgi:hypothetical protein